MPRKSKVSYEEGQRIARSLSLNNREAWEYWWKENGDRRGLPFRPHTYYKKSGWVSWDVWLGIADRKERRTMQSQGRVIKRAVNPTGPAPIPYKDLDLNIQRIDWRTRFPYKPTEYWNYNDCRIYIAQFELTRVEDLDARIYRYGAPKALNAGWWNHEPNQWEYGWKDWDEFLGVSDRSNWKDKGYVSLWDSRQHVWSLGLRSKTEWENYCAGGRLPSFIPSNPDVVYRDSGWTTWDDWLQYRPYKRGIRHSNPTWYNIDRARAIAWNYRIAVMEDWMSLCVMGLVSKRIPTRPDLVYPEWADIGGWSGFFGPTYVDKPYMEDNFAKSDIFRSKWHVDRHLDRYIRKIYDIKTEFVPKWVNRKAVLRQVEELYRRVKNEGKPQSVKRIEKLLPASD